MTYILKICLYDISSLPLSINIFPYILANSHSAIFAIGCNPPLLFTMTKTAVI